MSYPRLYDLDPHATTLPWLESPFTDQLLANAQHLDAASLELARRYAADGYVILDLDLPPSHFSDIVAGLAPLYGNVPGVPLGDPHRIQDAWMRAEPATAAKVRELALRPQILDALRMLYRREPVAFQTLNFSVGTQQAIHSDTVHFHSVPARYMCGVWVALEDIHVDAGPLHYYPGSHRMPVYTLADLGIAGSLRRDAQGQTEIYGEPYREYERFITAVAESSGLPCQKFTVKRGQALIWSANLLHGGSPVNNPALSRHSQVSHYFFEDSIYYTPLSSDLPLGRMATRDLIDIATGRKPAAKYCGLPLTIEALQLPRLAAPEARQVRLATKAPHRVLCWPRYDAPADLTRLAEGAGRALLGRDDACLCLRHDRTIDPPLASAMEAVDRAFCSVLGDAPPLQVLIVDDVVPPRAWGQLGAEASCILRLGDEAGPRAAFLHAQRRPVVGTSALRTLLAGAASA